MSDRQKRRVRVSPRHNYDETSFEAAFHCWSVAYDACEGGPDGGAVAIVERPDGKVEIVLPHRIQFLSPDQAPPTESDDLMATPWPPREVVAKLCEAVDHLLNDHSCDMHGYEGVGIARDVARRWLEPEKT